MNIEQLIGELLLRNNCVVIPKFGGFISTRKEASIDYEKGIIAAPKKAILFNKQLTNSDGLLINSFALKQGLSYEEAEKSIENQVKIWQQSLNEGERITIERVGFLYLDANKNLLFEQDRFFNLLLQSFGMTQVQFIEEKQVEEIVKPQETIKPLIVPKISLSINPILELDETIEETAKIIPLVAEEKDSKIIPLHAEKTIGKSSSKKIVKYLAAACILPFAFYSFWLPVKTDVLESGLLTFSDFNPFNSGKTASFEKKNLSVKFEKIPPFVSLEKQIEGISKDIKVYSMQHDDEVFFVKINEEQDSEIEIETANPISEKAIAAEKPVVINKTSGKLQIVVGSFSNQNNAQDLVNDLKSKGFDAYTFPQENGLIRVSAGRSNSQSEVQELVSKLSQLQVSSWILK
jgi:uncharacterized protein YheU (UPF0270 family)